jgi:hypothetical protein
MTAAARFVPDEPVSGPEIVAALRALQGGGEAYLATLPAAVFVRPQGEKWSPADHVRHLRKSIAPLVPALGLPRAFTLAMFGWNRRGSRSYALMRDVYLNALGAGVPVNRFAPSPRPAPDDAEAWRREVMTAWHASSVSLCEQIAHWNEPSLDRCRLPHPLLGKLSVREMLYFTLYHNSHHLNLIASRV